MKPSKESIQNFVNLIPPNTPEEELDFNWLDGLTYSQALVVCIGAGPWKETRRKNVQEHALKKLGDKDISEHNLDELVIEGWYPFDWQNKMLFKFIEITKLFRYPFNNCCFKITTDFDENYSKLTNILDIDINFADSVNIKTIAKLYSRMIFLNWYNYSNKIPKVISLFIRDKLKFPSFPLDRHVKRCLDEFNLPHDEQYIINICLNNNKDPSKLNRWIFKQKSSNPDWRKTLIEVL